MKVAALPAERVKMECVEVYSALVKVAATEPERAAGAPNSLYVVPPTRARTLQERSAPCQNCGVAVARFDT